MAIRFNIKVLTAGLPADAAQAVQTAAGAQATEADDKVLGAAYATLAPGSAGARAIERVLGLVTTKIKSREAEVAPLALTLREALQLVKAVPPVVVQPVEPPPGPVWLPPVLPPVPPVVVPPVVVPPVVVPPVVVQPKDVKAGLSPELQAALQRSGWNPPTQAWADELNRLAERDLGNGVFTAEPDDNAVGLLKTLYGMRANGPVVVGDAATMSGREIRAFFYGAVQTPQGPAVAPNFARRNATLIVKNAEALPDEFQVSLAKMLGHRRFKPVGSAPNVQAGHIAEGVRIVLLSRVELEDDAGFNQALVDRMTTFVQVLAK